MLLCRRSDASKLPGETKNDPQRRETSPGGGPFSHPSISRMIQHEHRSINGQQAHCQARKESAEATVLMFLMECSENFL